MRRILGIDPGLRHTGWGVICANGSRLSFIAAGRISPPPALDLADRLHYLHIELSRIIAHHTPTEAAIEQTFVSVNASSTLKLGNARGALLLSLAIGGLSVHEYDATLVKKSIVGAGRASKDQMNMMMRILLPAIDADASEDAIDALGIAITHAHHANAAAL
jgi:crossover junction endodeoxyribonuclease RuvC